MTKLRVAAAAVLASLAVAAPAQANTILDGIIQDALEGCYGVAVTVCDPHVSERPYELNSTPVPVCTGSCQTVNVPVPGLSGDNLCVAWTDHDGGSHQACALPDPQ